MLLSRRTLLKGCAATLLAGDGLGARCARAGELRVGAPAPPATLVTLDGRRISTTDLAGRVVVLCFWATWCVPCREELPLLSQYATRHADTGLQVLGFCLDEPDRLAEVRSIAHTLSFPVGLLSQSTVPGYGRIWRLPVNFTLDRAGRLANNGWETKNPVWTSESLEQIVTPLLS
jgi:thiol-disulfide isomerase/thioredoxin